MEPPNRIRRTIRACIQCRTRKQRCDGPFTVPCQRCKTAGRECSFETESIPEASSPRYQPYDRNQSPNVVAQLQRELSEHRMRLEALEHKLGMALRPTKSEEEDISGEKLAMDVSPDSWHDTTSPQSSSTESAQETPPKSHSVNSIVLSAPIATLRNLAHVSGLDISHAPPLSPADSPSGSAGIFNPGVPPLSVISTFDPVKRGILTIDEAQRLFDIFFDNCHPLAPFLCRRTQNKASVVRLASVLLFTSVCCIGARYWNHKHYAHVSSPQSWLHPRYSDIVGLLDNCISALLLRPSSVDVNLEAVQSMLLYVQWMPLQVPEPSTGQLPRSRFSDASAWTMMGVAIRFSTYLNLDRSVLLPFASRDVNISDADMNLMRVWLNLISVDYYLTLTASLPVCTDPIPASRVAREFGSHPCAQEGDIRLAGLCELVGILHEANLSCGDPSLRSLDDDSLRTCNLELEKWEKVWGGLVTSLSREPNPSPLSLQMPSTAVRWYRLAINGIHLGSTMTNWLRTPPGTPPPISLPPALEAASNMIYYLSSEAEAHYPSNSLLKSQPPRQFSLNAPALAGLRFAIDPYWACHAFAAVFLALLYDRGAINDELNIINWHRRPQAPPHPQSILYRLVVLAVDIFDTIFGPSIIHPAANYRKIVQNTVRCLSSTSYNPENESSHNAGTSDVEEIFSSLLDGGFDWTVFRDAAVFRSGPATSDGLAGSGFSPAVASGSSPATYQVNMPQTQSSQSWGPVHHNQ